MTRDGFAALREPLLAEASRHGLGSASDGVRFHVPIGTWKRTRRDLIGHFETNCARPDYADGKRRGEPRGSGAMESTCRQYQCRFKRPGRFWTKTGDEAVTCVETFRRNGRWQHLFPRAGDFDPSRN